MDVALRDYVDMRFAELEKSIHSALRSNELAVETSARVIDSRLESMNEFRNSLRDQTATYATRAALEAVRDQTNAKVESLQKVVNMAVGGLIVLQVVLSVLVTLFVAWR